MSTPSTARTYVLGPSPGEHAERVQLLQSLTATGLPVYIPEDRIALYKETLKHPYIDQLELFGDGVHTLEDAQVISRVTGRALKARREVTPWPWSLTLKTLPKDVLQVGDFSVCLDDSLLGDPSALLLHTGVSVRFRVSPPALTLPQQGPLRVVMLELVERDGRERLSVSVLGASHELIEGPWWITP